MKKTRILALTLVVAIMMMGAGYAYWTDTLTISNSITTGTFDVDFQADSDDLVVYQNYNFAAGTGTEEPAGLMGVTTGFGTDGDTLDNLNNNDKLTITATNLYPDGAYKVNATILNTSTIPVLFNTAGYTLSSSNLNDFLKIKVTIGGVATTIVPGTGSSLTGTLTLPVAQIAKDNGTVPVEVVVYLDHTASAEVTENASFTFTVTPSFRQFNGTTY